VHVASFFPLAAVQIQPPITHFFCLPYLHTGVSVGVAVGVAVGTSVGSPVGSVVGASVGGQIRKML